MCKKFGACVKVVYAVCVCVRVCVRVCVGLGFTKTSRLHQKPEGVSVRVLIYFPLCSYDVCECVCVKA